MEGKMDPKCEIFEQQAQPVLSVRTVTSAENLPNVLGQIYPAIIEHMDDLNERPAGEPFVAYHNMNLKEIDLQAVDLQNLNLEIGFPVQRTLPGKETIKPSEMPAGNYISCLHVGPYPDMVLTYKFIQDFISKNNLQPADIVYEFYLNSPEEVPQDELKTQILLPLQSE
jgi:effector-binding domain-containing protein